MRNKSWVLDQLYKRLKVCRDSLIAAVKNDQPMQAAIWEVRAEELSRAITLVETLEAL